MAKTNPQCPIILLERGETSLSEYLATDTGRKRTLSNYLKALGVKDYNSTAAIIARCVLIDSHPDGLLGQNDASMTSHAAMAAWWDECDQELLYEASRFGASLNSSIGAPRTAVSSIMYLASRDFDKEITFEFFSDVRERQEEISSDGLREPAKLLRDTFRSWRMNRSKTVPTRVVWYTIIKAFHFHLAGERKTILKLAHNETPIPVVPEWV